MTYYDILFSFFIYGFLGWCAELPLQPSNNIPLKPWILKRSDLSDLWNWRDCCSCIPADLMLEI